MENDLNWCEEELYLIAERGHLLYLQGRYREAAVLFDGLRAIEPENLYFTNALAAVYLKAGHPQAALALLDELVLQHPTDIESRMRRCEALIDAGRLEDARAEWRQMWARRRDPRLLRLSLRLGIQPEFENSHRGVN